MNITMDLSYFRSWLNIVPLDIGDVDRHIFPWSVEACTQSLGSTRRTTAVSLWRNCERRGAGAFSDFMGINRGFFRVIHQPDFLGVHGM